MFNLFKIRRKRCTYGYSTFKLKCPTDYHIHFPEMLSHFVPMFVFITPNVLDKTLTPMAFLVKPHRITGKDDDRQTGMVFLIATVAMKIKLCNYSKFTK